MPDEPGVTVVTTLVCFFILHARLRAQRAPGIPCALFRAEDSCTVRAHRTAGMWTRVRDRGGITLIVIAKPTSRNEGTTRMFHRGVREHQAPFATITIRSP